MKKFVLVASLILACVISQGVMADTIRVAVAANFKPTLEALSHQFEHDTGHKVLISSASTGSLYNQIKNGAPFDLFLSGDERRPKMLDKQGVILKGSRRTYALGQLVLWRPNAMMSLAELKNDKGRLAIANPVVAPYGLAARQVLEYMGLWKGIQPRLIQGNSIQQAWQYVASGNVPAGLVARSQMIAEGKTYQYTVIPIDYYQPLQQDLVILKRTARPKVATAFMEYLLSPSAQGLIESHGYFPASDRNASNKKVSNKKD